MSTSSKIKLPTDNFLDAIALTTVIEDIDWTTFNRNDHLVFGAEDYDNERTWHWLDLIAQAEEKLWI